MTGESGRAQEGGKLRPFAGGGEGVSGGLGPCGTRRPVWETGRKERCAGRDVMHAEVHGGRGLWAGGAEAGWGVHLWGLVLSLLPRTEAAGPSEAWLSLALGKAPGPWLIGSENSVWLFTDSFLSLGQDGNWILGSWLGDAPRFPTLIMLCGGLRQLPPLTADDKLCIHLIPAWAGSMPVCKWSESLVSRHIHFAGMSLWALAWPEPGGDWRIFLMSCLGLGCGCWLCTWVYGEHPPAQLRP